MFKNVHFFVFQDRIQINANNIEYSINYLKVGNGPKTLFLLPGAIGKVEVNSKILTFSSISWYTARKIPCVKLGPPSWPVFTKTTRVFWKPDFGIFKSFTKKKKKSLATDRDSLSSFTSRTLAKFRYKFKVDSSKSVGCANLALQTQILYHVHRNYL